VFHFLKKLLWLANRSPVANKESNFRNITSNKMISVRRALDWNKNTVKREKHYFFNLQNISGAPAFSYNNVAFAPTTSTLLSCGGSMPNVRTISTFIITNLGPYSGCWGPGLTQVQPLTLFIFATPNCGYFFIESH